MSNNTINNNNILNNKEDKNMNKNNKSGFYGVIALVAMCLMAFVAGAVVGNWRDSRREDKKDVAQNGDNMGHIETKLTYVDSQGNDYGLDADIVMQDGKECVVVGGEYIPVAKKQIAVFVEGTPENSEYADSDQDSAQEKEPIGHMETKLTYVDSQDKDYGIDADIVIHDGKECVVVDGEYIPVTKKQIAVFVEEVP